MIRVLVIFILTNIALYFLAPLKIYDIELDTFMYLLIVINILRFSYKYFIKKSEVLRFFFVLFCAFFGFFLVIYIFMDKSFCKLGDDKIEYFYKTNAELKIVSRTIECGPNYPSSQYFQRIMICKNVYYYKKINGKNINLKEWIPIEQL